jgi:hypothetical protein
MTPGIEPRIIDRGNYEDQSKTGVKGKKND